MPACSRACFVSTEGRLMVLPAPVRGKPATNDALGIADRVDKVSESVSGLHTVRKSGQSSDTARFVDEQVQGLVRQVFIPGYPRPAHQAVFSGASPDVRSEKVCIRVAEALAAEGAFQVCAVEADIRTRSMEIEFGGTNTGGRRPLELAEAVRMSSLQVSSHLWLVPAETFLGTAASARSPAWLRSRLGSLRREFDYAVIHGPSAGSGCEASLLGHLADGLVLVLEAHRTRRITIQNIRESLQSSNVRLLGAVLTERRFPIPEGLYRRL